MLQRNDSLIAVNVVATTGQNKRKQLRREVAEI
jgi:hypothetical protein